MNTYKSEGYVNSSIPKENKEELDLKLIFSALLRRKSIFAIVFGLCISTSYIITKRTIPIYEGSFQIVIDDNSTGGGSSSATLGLLESTGIQTAADGTMKTAIKILQSPSVLMPVFEYLKEEKAKSGVDYSWMKYRHWIPNFLFINEKSSKVLDIFYRSADKDLILPVLNRVSKRYQDYSGRDRARGISQGIKYLEEQLIKMRKVSSISLMKFETFSNDNGLGPETGLPIAVMPNVTIGTSGTLRSQANGLESIGDSSNEVTSTRTHTRYTELYKNLRILETLLIEKSTLLKDNDQSIIALKRRIKTMKEALKRPQDILVKHRELERKAVRDEMTLSQLESQLQVLKLDKAKQTIPWELISKPTVIGSPISPNPKKNLSTGALMGFILGTIASLIADKRSGLIFNSNELKNLVPYPLLNELPLDPEYDWDECMKLIAKGPLKSSSKEKISLLTIGNVSNEYLNLIASKLRKALTNSELIITRKSSDSLGIESKIILLELGTIKYNQLNDLIQKLEMQDVKPIGFILLNPDLKV
tara:strand:+ start:6633 stop:8231 length:1599 start_codon:yes stop_codon:yes gene_type:complete